MVAPFFNFTSSVRVGWGGVQFLHILTNICFLIGMKQYLTGVLICVFLLTNVMSFMCLLAIGIVFGYILCPFKIGLFVFFLSSCKSSLHILDKILISRVWLVDIFSHSMDCLFTFSILSLEAQNFKISIKSSVFFLLLLVLLGSYLENCLVQGRDDIHVCLSLRLL